MAVKWAQDTILDSKILHTWSNRQTFFQAKMLSMGFLWSPIFSSIARKLPWCTRLRNRRNTEEIIRACVPKKFFYTLYLILFNTLTLTHTAAIFKMTDKITWGWVTLSFAFQPPSLLGLCIFGCNVIIKLMKLTLIWICTVII